MKTLIYLIALILLPCPVKAENVTLVWDANPASESVASYTLIYGNTLETMDQSVTVSALTATVDLGPGTWFFAAYATNDEGTSGPVCDAISTRIMKPAPGKVRGAKVIRLPVQGSAKPRTGSRREWDHVGWFYPATDRDGETIYDRYRIADRKI